MNNCKGEAVMETLKQDDLTFSVKDYKFSTYVDNDCFTRNVIYVYLSPKDNKELIKEKILNQIIKYQYLEGEINNLHTVFDESHCKVSDIVDYCFDIIGKPEFFNNFWGAILQSRTQYLRYGLVINLIKR